MGKEKQVVNSTRIEWIDFAKGIAIFLVVLGHAVEYVFPENSVNKVTHMVIYSFHMPFFFMLSGMTFSDEKYSCFKTIFYKKFFTLIVPSYIFAIITMLIECVKELVNAGTITYLNASGIIRMLLQYRVGASANYWFLPTLFLGLIIMWCVHKLFKKDIHRMTISLLISIIAAFYIHWIAKPLPFSVDNAVLICFFLELGYQLKNKINRIKERKNFLFVVACIMWFLSLYVNYKCYEASSISLAYVTLLNPVMFFVEAISGSFIIISICSKVARIPHINGWGQNTLVIYWLNTVIIDVFANLINKHDLSNSVVIIVLCLIVSIIVIEISNILSIFIKKYCSFLLGMKNNRK